MRYTTIIPILVVAALTSRWSTHHSTSAPLVTAAGCAWTSVKAPVQDLFVDVQAVDGVPADDVWAVGSQRAGGQPLILRRSGGKWVAVSGPAPREGVLRAVDARTPTDVWAVGSQLPNGASNLRTLIQHYDGKSWKVIKSPNPFPGANVLKGVVALSADDAWAVGGNGIPGSHAILLHYNGVRWTAERPAALPGQADLLDIDRYFGSKELIAVGRRGGTSEKRQLVLSYDGQSWRQEPIKDPAQNGKELFGVSNSVTVGTQSGSAALRAFGMNRVFEGTSLVGWEVATTQDSGDGINILYGVSMQSRHKTYQGFAVGYYETPQFTSRTLVLELKNSGRRWEKMSSPNVTSKDNVLNDVYVAPLSSQAPSVQAWAVGTASKPIGSVPLVLEYTC